MAKIPVRERFELKKGGIYQYRTITNKDLYWLGKEEIKGLTLICRNGRMGLLKRLK